MRLRDKHIVTFVYSKIARKTCLEKDMINKKMFLMINFTRVKMVTKVNFDNLSFEYSTTIVLWLKRNDCKSLFWSVK